MSLDPPDSDGDPEVHAEEIESASSEHVTPDMPPEVDRRTEQLTVWDEPASSAGVSAPKVPMEDEANLPEELIEEGIDEADREQRIAAADPDFEP